MIDIRFIAFLGLAALVTAFFSMFNAPQIRGFRNIGFLVTYAGSIAWFFIAGFWPVVVTWCGFGTVTGMLYYSYDLMSVARSTERPKEWPSPTTIVHGLAAWPIMLPEVAEYALADVGILKALPVAPPDTPESEPTDIPPGSGAIR